MCTFAPMKFTSQLRHNLETGEYEKYYRLKESYRDASGRPCTRILLNVGFIHGLSPVAIVGIRTLTRKLLDVTVRSLRRLYINRATNGQQRLTKSATTRQILCIFYCDLIIRSCLLSKHIIKYLDGFHRGRKRNLVDTGE